MHLGLLGPVVCRNSSLHAAPSAHPAGVWSEGERASKSSFSCVPPTCKRYRTLQRDILKGDPVGVDSANRHAAYNRKGEVNLPQRGTFSFTGHAPNVVAVVVHVHVMLKSSKQNNYTIDSVYFFHRLHFFFASIFVASIFFPRLHFFSSPPFFLRILASIFFPRPHVFPRLHFFPRPHVFPHLYSISYMSLSNRTYVTHHLI